MNSALSELKYSLIERLKREIPAERAHQKIMQSRLPVKDIEEKVKQARKAGVLLLLYPKELKLHTVFILRAEYEGVHSNQVSLPGGAMEVEDDSLLTTALREANEELAIQTEKVEVLGSLSSIYVPPSNFVIQPYIGIQSTEGLFIPDPYEVKSIIECPVECLIGEEKVIEREIVVRKQQRMRVKGFQLGENLLWGATAMIVKEFAEIMAELKVPNVLAQNKRNK